MTVIDPPITLSEATALRGILMESLRVLQGLEFRFPMVGAANIGNVMYQVTIVDYRDAAHRENVVATIRSREWSLVIPASAYYRDGKIDLSMHLASQTQGTRDELKRGLTLVAMFLDD